MLSSEMEKVEGGRAGSQSCEVMGARGKEARLQKWSSDQEQLHLKSTETMVTTVRVVPWIG